MAHPVLDAASAIGRALDGVAEVNPAFMGTDDKAAALQQLVRLEARLTELRLRVMADAGDVADDVGARDVADWLAHHSHLRGEDARADLRLAHAVGRRWTALGAALRAGRVSVAQAHVIARTLDDLPADEVGVAVMTRAEVALLEHALTLGPRQLGRVGRRILELVAPGVADHAEARRLAELERQARRRTRLSLHPLGDGTTRISGLIPDASAHRLRTYLEAFTNPRKHPDAAGDTMRRPYPRRLGEPFVQLLESIDPARLPLHGGDATTVVVTVPLTSLRAELGTADVVGADDPITAAEARRLACTAQIVPAVLGGASELLDLGRSARLFSPAQRRALQLRDRHCRAEGCDIPAAWCEAHHETPWSHGGRTDVEDGVLLCSHHHHRAHDPDYVTDRMRDGTVRYRRRRRPMSRSA